MSGMRIVENQWMRRNKIRLEWTQVVFRLRNFLLEAKKLQIYYQVNHWIIFGATNECPNQAFIEGGFRGRGSMTDRIWWIHSESEPNNLLGLRLCFEEPFMSTNSILSWATCFFLLLPISSQPHPPTFNTYLSEVKRFNHWKKMNVIRRKGYTQKMHILWMSECHI